MSENDEYIKIYNDICDNIRNHISSIHGILRKLKKNPNDFDEASECMMDECKRLELLLYDIKRKFLDEGVDDGES